MYKHLLKDKRHSRATWDEQSIQNDLLITYTDGGISDSRFK